MTERSSSAGRRRAATPDEYDVPTREPRVKSPRAARTLMAGVFAVWIIGIVLAGTAVVAFDLPWKVNRAGAALLLVVFAMALTHRVGGHMRIWAALAGILGVTAAVTGLPVLVASAAGVSAVVAAVWAIVFTRPALTVVQAVGEYVVAIAIALSGTVAVAAWNASVSYARFNMVVVAAALGLSIMLVWNLGAGLHGLGREHLLVLSAVAALIVLVLAYASFVRSHGSEWVTDMIASIVIWMRQTVGGVPRPVEVFLGFPALIVGVSLRARTREGWWIMVFGVISTSVLTTSLVSPRAFPTYIALSTLYSAVLGLIFGLFVRRVVVPDHSRRATRVVEPERRIEPARLAALK
ncbi:MAG: hypothetical protein ACJ71Z_01400 [Aeromicrobium sp.]